MIRERADLSRDELRQDYNANYWDKRYTLRGVMIPWFLKPCADQILTTGERGGEREGARACSASRIASSFLVVVVLELIRVEMTDSDVCYGILQIFGFKLLHEQVCIVCFVCFSVWLCIFVWTANREIPECDPGK